MPNFPSIGQTCAEIQPFLLFKMAAAAILDFQNVGILGMETVKRPKYITVPNFALIGQTGDDIQPFFDFSRWPPSPSWIFKI